MKLSNLIVLSVVLCLSGSAYGQKIKVASGKLASLSGIEKVNVEYDFSTFGVGKFDVEQDYLDHRSAEMNEDEAGKGDEWVEYWNTCKEKKYQPRFEDLFAKYSEKVSITDDASEVTMIVKTTFIEPGFNVGVMRKPSLINLTITFKKGDEELVVITIEDSPGNAAGGYDFDSGLRIQESYAKAGKEFGKFLTKKI